MIERRSLREKVEVMRKRREEGEESRIAKWEEDDGERLNGGIQMGEILRVVECGANGGEKNERARRGRL
jgi:hypothetical protein